MASLSESRCVPCSGQAVLRPLAEIIPPKSAKTASARDPRSAPLVPATPPLLLERPPHSVWPAADHAATPPGDGLWMVYNDALWLGEGHTSLCDFIQHVQRLELANESVIPLLVVRLALMLRPRSIIQRRYDMEAAKVLASSHLSTTEPMQLYADNDEFRAVRAALRGGAATAVAGDLQPKLIKGNTAAASDNWPETGRVGVPRSMLEPGSSLCRWLKAIESRELQLQVLLTLLLLKITTKHSSCIEPSKRSLEKALLASSAASASTTCDAVVSDLTPEDAGTRPKKRSRKLDRPKRWDAGLDANLQGDRFLWQRKLGGKKSRDGDVGINETDAVLEISSSATIEPEHLNRRFEALTDVLCLDQITANLHLELESFLTDPGDSASSNTDAPQINLPASRPALAFGTAARHKEPDEELDDVQWLSQKVVEPCFGAVLSRQCMLLKGKCFVSSASDATPARPRVVKARSGDSLQPTERGSAATRSANNTKASKSRSSAAAVSRPRLRDALEQEVASGRRVRGQAAADSQSFLSRGREVDMNRRFARSVSVGSSILGSHLGDGDDGRSLTSLIPLTVGAAGSQASARAFITGKMGKRKSEAVRRAGPIEPPMLPVRSVGETEVMAGQSRQTLVLSTPRKARTVYHRPTGRPAPFASSARKALESSSSSSSTTIALASTFRQTESQPAVTGGEAVPRHGSAALRTLDTTMEEASLPSAFHGRSPSPIAVLSGSASEAE